MNERRYNVRRFLDWLEANGSGAVNARGRGCRDLPAHPWPDDTVNETYAQQWADCFDAELDDIWGKPEPQNTADEAPPDDSPRSIDHGPSRLDEACPHCHALVSRAGMDEHVHTCHASYDGPLDPLAVRPGLTTEDIHASRIAMSRLPVEQVRAELLNSTDSTDSTDGPLLAARRPTAHCPTCGVVVDKRQLTNHIRARHPVGPEDRVRCPAPGCPAMPKRQIGLPNHIHTRHPEQAAELLASIGHERWRARPDRAGGVVTGEGGKRIRLPGPVAAPAVPPEKPAASGTLAATIVDLKTERQRLRERVTRLDQAIAALKGLAA